MSKKILRWPVAILDIGSNSVRMVVYARENPAKPFFNAKVACLLGKDLDRTGKLSPQGKKAAHHAIAGFRELAVAMGVGSFFAIATAAVRDAKDGAMFVQSIRRRIGVPVNIISGDLEASYSAAAVLASFPKAEGIVADLGGGSLDLARIGRGTVHETVSLQLGVLRLGNDKKSADAAIARNFSAIPEKFGKGLALYAVGGTCRAMATVHSRLNKRSGKVNGFSMRRTDLEKMRRRLMKMETAEIMRAFDVDESRAAALPQACYLMSLLMKRMDSARFVVSTKGVRDGFLKSLMSSR